MLYWRATDSAFAEVVVGCVFCSACFSVKLITPAPSMMSSTPHQRSPETSSCRTNLAAIVVSTKLIDVNGQMKLTFPLDNRMSSVPKYTASKKTPSRMLELVAPFFTRRKTSEAFTFCISPICLRPLFKLTTAIASQNSPMNNKVNNLVNIRCNSLTTNFSRLFETEARHEFQQFPRIFWAKDLFRTSQLVLVHGEQCVSVTNPDTESARFDCHESKPSRVR